MLSGYSLYYVYQSIKLSKINQLASFYKKRVFGLFPTYYVAALIYTIFFASGSVLKKVALIPIEAFGLQSVYNSLFDVSHNGGTWFISCIFICYLIFPLIQIICKQISDRIKYIFILVIGLILLISPFIVRIYNLSSIYSNPFFRILEFALGVILSSLCIKERISKILANKAIILLELCCIIAIISFFDRIKFGSGNYMFLSSALLLPIGLIILGLANTEFGSFINNKVVLYFSSLSYCFFLSQLFMPPLGHLVFKSFDCPNILRISILFFMCFVISIVLHEFIEKPIAKLIKLLKVV